MSKHQIRMWSGALLEPMAPDWRCIHIEDIARGLSNMCRFAGQLGTFYSVAQHACLVSSLCPPAHKVQGLHHDDTEGLGLPDLCKPVKTHPDLKGYRDGEDRMQHAVMTCFGLPLELSPEVHAADFMALLIENRELRDGASLQSHEGEVLPEIVIPVDANWCVPWKWTGIDGAPRWDAWPPELAYRLFMDYYQKLALQYHIVIR